jgi:4,5-DOPA dioxygenase extradiol
MEQSSARATAGHPADRRGEGVRLPTLFLSHGSPMHAVDPGAAGRAWAALGRELPRPRAVLIASAHWETSVPLLTGNPAPQTIHDFGGFPDELFRLQYAAPGDPALAAHAVALLKAAGVAAGIDGCRGRDHGAWVPLRWMYPEADVPVVQLAIQPELGAAHHLRVGRALAPLAGDAVLIIGSGHTTHNLRDWMSNPRRQEPLRYAQVFAEWVHDRLTAADVDALVAWREQAPEAARAHPTDEHFLPLFIALGAAAAGGKVERFVGGFEAGALAMDSYRFDPD